MSGPYSIPLLNQLHEHFPDLLYLPHRFHSVTDVLQYIISIARQNPYDREQERHHHRHVSSLLSTTVPVASSARSSSTASTASSSFPSTASLSSSSFPSTASSTSPFSRSFFSTRGGRRGASVSAASSIPRAMPQEPVEEASIQRVTIPLSALLSNSPSNHPSSGPPMQLLGNLIALLSSADEALSPEEHITAQQMDEHTLAYHWDAEAEEECCSICHDTFVSGVDVRRLMHCGHVFHKACIDTWLSSHVTCPNCRHDIRMT